MSTSTLNQIKEILTKHFTPSLIEVIDDSHLHIGHIGAKDGKGHYTVIITSDFFNGKSKPTQHRLIYQALGNLMQTHIHALSIKIKP